jgi:hypothetical protein
MVRGLDPDRHPRCAQTDAGRVISRRSPGLDEAVLLHKYSVASQSARFVAGERMRQSMVADCG